MHPLDNPAWHALTGEQRQFGQVGERSARYLPDVSPIASVADASPEALLELAHIVATGDAVALFNPGDLPPEQWRKVTTVPLTQWVCPDPVLEVATDVEWVELGEAEVSKMYRLVKQTDPGPFEMQTYLLGDYVGVMTDDGRLVAMAGERICFDGHREVSAVCTDPAFRGRGYARALVAEIARRQQARGCEPFLHIRVGSPAETQATRAYESVRFVVRRQIDMTVLVRL